MNIKQLLGNLQNCTVIPNVSISPDMAARLLEMNDGNRPLTAAVVDRYADAMRRKEWRFTGDTIGISNTGRLLNGQHRLSAIVKSGTAQKFNIQTGLEESVFDVLDTGKNRTSADVLSIAGISYATIIPGAVKIIQQYYSKRVKNTTNIRIRSKLSSHQILEWIKKNDAQESLERYAQISAKMYSSARFLSHSSYCAFLYIFSGKNREQAIEFFETLSTGENISSTHLSMIYLLRKRFIDMQLKNVRMANQSDKWALLIKAWNAYRDGREIKQLSYNPDAEEFPVAK